MLVSRWCYLSFLSSPGLSCLFVYQTTHTSVEPVLITCQSNIDPFSFKMTILTKVTPSVTPEGSRVLRIVANSGA